MSKRQRYTDEDLLQQLRKADQRTESNLSTMKYRELQREEADINASGKTISDRFETWNQAKEEAGLQTTCSNADIFWSRRQVKEWFKEMKASLSCERCGYSHPAALHFHHRDSENKQRGISRMVSSWDSSEDEMQELMEEMSKCEVICANCHSKEHWKPPTDN